MSVTLVFFYFYVSLLVLLLDKGRPSEYFDTIRYDDTERRTFKHPVYIKVQTPRPRFGYRQNTLSIAKLRTYLTGCLYLQFLRPTNFC